MSSQMGGVGGSGSGFGGGSSFNPGGGPGFSYNPTGGGGGSVPGGYGNNSSLYKPAGYQRQFNQAGNDVFGQAAAGNQGAMASAFQGLNFSPMSVNYQGYNPSGYDANMIDPSAFNNMGYNPAQVGAASYNPSANVRGGSYDAGQLSNTNLDPYMNPFTQNVTDLAVDDINRSRQMMGNQLDAQAQSAGGFGGSRQALMQTENDRNAMDQVGKTSAALNQANFANAQQMGMADIGNRNQASQFNLGLDMQSQLANQQAQNQAGQFNAANQMTAGLANQGAANQASQFDIGNRMSGLFANQGAANQAGQFNASAQNQAGQYNAGQNLQAQGMNQAAQMDANAQRMQQQQLLGNLANAGFGMGMGVNNQLGQQGAQQQAMMQQLINAGKGQFGNFTGMPQQQQQLLQSLMSSMPGGGGTSTASKQNGMMDYATLAMGLFSMFGASDERLKDNIQPMGKYPGTNHNMYVWDWNEEALRLGLGDAPSIGVLAHEVRETQAELVSRAPNGYLQVRYGGLQ